VRTAPNGDVYVAWEESLNRFSPNAIVVSKSVDGGEHFTRPISVASTITDVPSPLNGAAFRDATPKAGFRDNSFPSMTVAADGTVYLTWGALCSAGTCGARTEVFMTKSTDGGETWSAPAIVSKRLVNTGDPGDQFFPWITTTRAGSTNAVAIVYYDRPYDTTR